MKNAIRIFAAAALCVLAGISNAAEVKLLSALGFKEVIDELGPKFERASSHKLAIKFGTLGELVKLVQGGETADLIIIPRQGIDALAKDGKLSGNAVPLASSSIVIVVRKGAPKPDISSPEALKRALLNAKSITYGNPADGGASAVHFAKVLERLGIDKEMKAKTLYAKPGGDTAVQVANGKAELGVNQLQVMVPVPGIEVAGPLPGDLQATTVFAGSVMARSKEPGGAKALVDFLRTPCPRGNKGAVRDHGNIAALRYVPGQACQLTLQTAGSHRGARLVPVNVAALPSVPIQAHVPFMEFIRIHAHRTQPSDLIDAVQLMSCAFRLTCRDQHPLSQADVLRPIDFPVLIAQHQKLDRRTQVICHIEPCIVGFPL
jgi:molybdate transport system substrate-binding protein